MAVTELVYIPSDGFKNATSFPTYPTNQTAVREQLQRLLDQIRDYINDEMLVDIAYDYATKDDLAGVVVGTFPPGSMMVDIGITEPTNGQIWFKVI